MGKVKYPVLVACGAATPHSKTRLKLGERRSSWGHFRWKQPLKSGTFRGVTTSSLFLLLLKS